MNCFTRKSALQKRNLVKVTINDIAEVDWKYQSALLTTKKAAPPVHAGTAAFSHLSITHPGCHLFPRQMYRLDKRCFSRLADLCQYILRHS